MLQPNEFRIGNLVFDSETAPHIFEVEQISKRSEFTKLCVIYRNGSIKTIEPEGVELTKEMLLMFGFIECGQYFILNDIRLYKYHSAFTSEYFVFDYGLTQKFLEIKYVHQLQNLYFDLTGEELTKKN